MDYKKYCLENLENWIHDAMSAGEATPQEIYDTIHKVVEENYYTYKKQASEAYELLTLLNGNGKGHIEAYDDYVKEVLSEREYYEGKDDGMRPWGHSDIEYQIANQSKTSSCDKDDTSPECQGAWNDFWGEKYTDEEITAMCDAAEKKDKVVKWQLPVEMDGLTGECYVQFPDDLLEQVGWKEGDTVEYVPSENGFYVMRKV